MNSETGKCSRFEVGGNHNSSFNTRNSISLQEFEELIEGDVFLTREMPVEPPKVIHLEAWEDNFLIQFVEVESISGAQELFDVKIESLRGGVILMKQNAVIPIFYKTEGNKTYVIDVTTRKIYWHKHKPFNVNKNFIAGCSALFVAAIVPMMHNWLASQGLDNLSVSIRVLLIFIGIIVGILVFFIAREKRNPLQFEEFIIRYPEAKGVNEIAEIEALLPDISYRVSIIKFVFVGAPLIGIVLFFMFLNNSSLLVYGWGVLCFALSGFIAIFYKDIIFLSKIKEVDDISYKKTNEMKLREEVNSGGSELVNEDDSVINGAADMIDWDKLTR